MLIERYHRLTLPVFCQRWHSEHLQLKYRQWKLVKFGGGYLKCLDSPLLVSSILKLCPFRSQPLNKYWWSLTWEILFRYSEAKDVFLLLFFLLFFLMKGETPRWTTRSGCLLDPLFEATLVHCSAPKSDHGPGAEPQGCGILQQGALLDLWFGDESNHYEPCRQRTCGWFCLFLSYTVTCLTGESSKIMIKQPKPEPTGKNRLGLIGVKVPGDRQTAEVQAMWVLDQTYCLTKPDSLEFGRARCQIALDAKAAKANWLAGCRRVFFIWQSWRWMDSCLLSSAFLLCETHAW